MKSKRKPGSKPICFVFFWGGEGHGPHDSLYKRHWLPSFAVYTSCNLRISVALPRVAVGWFRVMRLAVRRRDVIRWRNGGVAAQRDTANTQRRDGRHVRPGTDRRYATQHPRVPLPASAQSLPTPIPLSEAFVCLSVCRLFHTISQKPMQLASLNFT